PSKDLNLYDFKATAMTMLRDDGVSPAWIEAAARHRGQGVTSRHYSFDTLDQARKAIDRLAVLLEKAAKKKRKRSTGGKAWAPTAAAASCPRSFNGAPTCAWSCSPPTRRPERRA